MSVGGISVVVAIASCSMSPVLWMLLLNVSLHVRAQSKTGRAVFAGEWSFGAIAALFLFGHKNTVLDDHLHWSVIVVVVAIVVVGCRVGRRVVGIGWRWLHLVVVELWLMVMAV